jgi:predicted Zn-ribbon and HTH transcriptional regulator
MQTKLTTRTGRFARLAGITKLPEVKPALKSLDPPGNQVALMCHYCAYEPPMARIPADNRCPKCRGCSWERFIIPKRIFPLNG